MSYVNRIEWRLRYTLEKISTAGAELFWSTIGMLSRKRKPPEVKVLEPESLTPVDSFWGEHTVNSKPFKAASQSEKYLEWRAQAYPLFTEFMQLYGDHDDEVILDYGCGPGNDLVGFAIHTRARKIVGIDISEKALNLARQRLALHDVAPEKIELIQSADTICTIPLEDASVDYIHSAGVLHHTTDPSSLLREFYRILKHDSRACVMVYNRDSVWLHLYAAYEKIVLQNAFPGLNAFEAFSQTVDVEPDGTGRCPIARHYEAGEFTAMCDTVGFCSEYVGGYLSDIELHSLQKYGAAALQDERMPDVHKLFLRNLVIDERGFPRYKGKHAGIGGVYWLYKK